MKCYDVLHRIDMIEKKFKNPFPERVQGDYLTLYCISRLIAYGFPFEKLPEEVQVAIMAERKRLYEEYLKKSPLGRCLY